MVQASGEVYSEGSEAWSGLKICDVSRVLLTKLLLESPLEEVVLYADPSKKKREMIYFEIW